VLRSQRQETERKDKPTKNLLFSSPCLDLRCSQTTFSPFQLLQPSLLLLRYPCGVSQHCDSSIQFRDIYAPYLTLESGRSCSPCHTATEGHFGGCEDSGVSLELWHGMRRATACLGGSRGSALWFELRWEVVISAVRMCIARRKRVLYVRRFLSEGWESVS